jgi:hypothetical protein
MQGRAPMNVQPPTLPLGLLRYDEEHVDQLTLAILQAIITTSTTNDAVTLRGREIRHALARALAEFVALEPDSKTRRLIHDHSHFARRLVEHHRRDIRLELKQFRARMTRLGLSGGGRG